MLVDGIWLNDIPGWSVYKISSHGALYSLPRRGSKRGWIKSRPHGGEDHLYVILHERGRKWQTTIHKLVAMAWLPLQPDDKPSVLHNDGDCWNNCCLNLRYGTQQENMDDREKHGRTSRGEAHSKIVVENRERIGWKSISGDLHPRTKLSFAEVLEVRERLNSGALVKDLAREYDVSRTQIYYIRDLKSRKDA